ncbi:23S rRNA (pseudouridine(1915)-N(3))-methyltransferase RlmH [Candidatus Paracaedibacter symbiosus]|uniref:23S rRNA (pseudouridine(1915)-N(3))-methyltransferase RlmH n=1 Tax=Candidatus Paracaedibacter symbiosus TaxID=244582 RepID=UPI000509B01A|nr:23S rRNA (pseudouridine(1915)-N(3))-methyltransferase RlmH [Candidatus Paracaedibacter symbiosus]
MKINLVVMGQLKDGPEHDLIQKYVKRLHWKLAIKQLVCKKNMTGAELKAAEAELIRGALISGAPLLALDERGQNLTSDQFATTIQKFQLRGTSEFNICIGGAEGLHQNIRDQADLLISFGALTWPHMLVRVMVLEQLYRAQQILAGHPYHKV